MLTITSKSPYALRALTELARSGSGAPVPIGELARRRDIPVQFLEGLFATLRRAGVLQSQRGVKGGYSFGRAPEEVTVLEVVETVDGRLAAGAPVDPSRAGAESVWDEARARLAELLGGLTVADVLDREARLQGAPMFHI